jgi:uncharacterized protein YbjT (DUF2867 family)
MAKKIIAVTGATGHVGSAAAKRLRAAGHEVREVTRGAGVPVDDVAKLTRAFTGADAVFLMIPPDLKAPDPRKRMDELGAKLAEAVKAAGVRRVVFLSSINAHLKEGTGPILGLHDMEERLNALDIPQLVHLRPAFFMENHLQGVGYIARHGVYGAPVRADVALPMIAAADIGAKAAELLAAETFAEPRTRELLGPRDYTMLEAARLLGAAVGRPNLAYVQIPYEESRAAAIGFGISAGWADAMVELNRHFNESVIHGTEARSAVNTTETTLETFAREVFLPVFEMAAGAVR